MSKPKVLLVGITILGFALFLVPLKTYAEEIDSDTSVVYGSVEDPGADLAVTCTLTVPSNVQNGENFRFSVNYNPPAPAGNRTEKFIFRWPSRVGYFKEKTVRMKFFTPASAGHSASFESAVAPDAWGVEGTFKAKVKVTGSVTCIAKAWMTVTNPP